MASAQLIFAVACGVIAVFYGLWSRSWVLNQDPGNGGQEPEHPAPTIHLVATASDANAKDAPARVTAANAPASDDGTARLLGGLGLAVGIVGLAVGAYGLMRRRTS